MHYLFAAVLAVVLSLPVAAQDLNKGVEAFKNKDYATALREFRPLAEQGNAAAQFALGLMYAEGDGVPQDYSKAAKWLRLAADQGFPPAQDSLGHLYANGQGVTQDYAEAAKWFRKAAEQGLADAQYRSRRLECAMAIDGYMSCCVGRVGA